MRGIPLLLGILILAAPTAAAGGNCDLARQVSGLDVSSRLLLAETQPGKAARIVRRMARNLGEVEPPDPLARTPEPGSAAARMRDYIATRETLVKVFDNRGLSAAHAFLRADTTGDSIRNIRAALNCGAPHEASGSGGQGGLGSGMQLGSQVINGALVNKAKRRLEPTIERHFSVPMLAFPALILTIVLLSRLLNRRQFTRYPCDLPASVALPDRVMNGRIVDISRGGAKIRADNAASTGERGAMTLETGMAFDFRVAWANSRFIGVSFQPALEISPKRLLGL